MTNGTGDRPRGDATGGPETASARQGRGHRRGRESRARILREMLALVEEQGFEGATITRLAARTGLPASSIYWHFENKDAILTEALRQGIPGTPQHTLPGRPDDRDLLDQLAEVFERLLDDGQRAGAVRVGLTLGLLPNSIATGARDVFLGVRAATRAQFVSWWGAVIADLATGPIDPHAADALAGLSIAAFDGRFLTGRGVDITAANAAVLGRTLLAAARRMAAGAALPPSGPGPVLTGPPAQPAVTAREVFVRAATRVLCEHGYDGATVARICQGAGLPASSLYWHFSDRDALLEEVVVGSFAAWQRRAGTEWRTDTADLRVELEQAMTRGLQAMRAEPAAFRIGYGLLLRRQDSAARRQFRQLRIATIERLAGWFAHWIGEPPPVMVDPGDPAAIEPGVVTSSLAAMLGWAAMTMSDGLFLVEALDPGTIGYDVAPLLAAALADVMEQARDGALDDLVGPGAAARPAP